MSAVYEYSLFYVKHASTNTTEQAPHRRIIFLVLLLSSTAHQVLLMSYNPDATQPQSDIMRSYEQHYLFISFIATYIFHGYYWCFIDELLYMF
jgi:hypothetical protein